MGLCRPASLAPFLLWEVDFTASYFHICFANDVKQVSHGTELVWVFGGGYFVNPSPATLYFSGQMVDYWISFATSLDPNDGRGNDRKERLLSVVACFNKSIYRTTLAAIYSVWGGDSALS